MCMVLIFIILYHEQIFKWVYSLATLRESSTATRTNIYMDSLSVMWNNSPLLGCGIKVMRGNYPLGSHSTWIGFLYKTGIIGTVFAVAGIGKIYCLMVKRSDRLFALYYGLLLFMLCVEDLDGADWILILFFILSAVAISRGRNGDGIINQTK